MTMRFKWMLTAAVCVAALSGVTAAEEPQNHGDVRPIQFTLPFEVALKKAKAENRLILLKPIYGGVDQLGERDYRCGSW